MDPDRVHDILEDGFDRYARPDFIDLDPVSVPRRFARRDDAEIAGFFAAVLAWGQRVTILNKCQDLLDRMDRAPADFIRHHTEADLRRLEGFVHRTFNDTDLLYFVHALQRIDREHGGLEAVVARGMGDADNIGPGLAHLHDVFFDDQLAPPRTRKHVATPIRKSTCKRLNMYLRWMVRTANEGVDLGIWTRITPSALLCPLDVHVARSARHLGLLTRRQNDWKAVVELTDNLRRHDPIDPVRYDIVLFALSESGDLAAL